MSNTHEPTCEHTLRFSSAIAQELKKKLPEWAITNSEYISETDEWNLRLRLDLTSVLKQVIDICISEGYRECYDDIRNGIVS